MDRKTELSQKLEKFRLKLEKDEKPLQDMWLEEAYPGDNSTSFILKVRAKWLDELSLSEGLDILLDALWKTTNVATRTKVFAVYVAKTTDKNVKIPYIANQAQTEPAVFV